MRLIVVILLVLWTGSAAAHHEAESRMRVVLVEELGHQTIIYVRLPAPLLFTAESMARASPYDRVEAPFLRVERQQDVWIHRLDRRTAAEEPDAFAARIGATLAITLGGVAVAPTLTDFAVHSANALPPFATPDEARLSLAAAAPAAGADPVVGFAFVDARLQIDGTGSLTIGSALNERAIPPQIYIENIVIDYRTDPAKQILRLGALDHAIALEQP